MRPIFAENAAGNAEMPRATPAELAAAIAETVDAGARVINLSAALLQPSGKGERELEHALDYAAQRGVLVVAAAGNQSRVGSSVITRHPWVIPVVACDLQGRPTAESNLGGSIGRWGLAASGENIVSLGSAGKPQTYAGTSAAAPFVTGNDCVAAVEVSLRKRSRGEARAAANDGAQEHGRAAGTGCGGGI